MKILQSVDPCQICFTKDRNVISEVSRDFKKLVTVICTGCGLIHSHPIPKKKELKDFYEKEYRLKYKSCLKPKLKHVFRYGSHALPRVNYIKKFLNKNQKTLLDIGSGSGEFLYMALKSGFDAKGIEPNIGYANYSKKYLDLPVKNTTYDDAGLKNQSYHIVNLVDVLEHLPEPLSCLSFINRILKEDGILSISVPNIDFFGHSPLTQFHYAHIYNFNSATLKAILFKAGFEILDLKNHSTTFVAKKVREPNAAMKIMMIENYQLLDEKFKNQSLTEHYKTSAPYSRFFKKCYQYTLEFFFTLFMRSPKKILDYFYNK
jgi:2-polyprenyl-3-methyl-5-hydroxy-6-metoxy-1,4-benzoquinol methylase